MLLRYARLGEVRGRTSGKTTKKDEQADMIAELNNFNQLTCYLGVFLFAIFYTWVTASVIIKLRETSTPHPRARTFRSKIIKFKTFEDPQRPAPDSLPAFVWIAPFLWGAPLLTIWNYLPKIEHKSV